MSPVPPELIGGASTRPEKVGTGTLRAGPDRVADRDEPGCRPSRAAGPPIGWSPAATGVGDVALTAVDVRVVIGREEHLIGGDREVAREVIVRGPVAPSGRAVPWSNQP